MAKIKGWTGTILRVDLTKGKIKKENPPKSFYERWIGGRGLGTKILWDEVPPDTDPLSPDNIFVYSAGALTGTGVPQGNKGYTVYKSPFSGHIGGGSVGDYLASELKFAGYDAVILTGKAKKPVYIWINNDKVEIRDAGHLWGTYTLDAIKKIREELGGDINIQIGLIGPSGENLVRMACFRTGFMNAQGKCGGGAVLGSKNVKAIAIRGTQPVQLAHPDKMLKYIREYLPVLKETPAYKLFSYYGTPGAIPGYLNMNSHNNFTANKDLSPHNRDMILERYVTRLKACWACPVHCKRYHQISSGPYAGIGSGPDISLQASCMQAGMNDAEHILSVEDLANEYGIDWWMPMLTIAWATECFEKGVLTTKDTDGLKLKFGDEETTEEMYHRMATREGNFGNLLAEGPFLGSTIIGRGSERYAPLSKGMMGTRDARLNEPNLLWWLGSPRGGGLQKGLIAYGWMGQKKEGLVPLMGEKETALYFNKDTKSIGFGGLFVHAENITALIYDSFGVCVYGAGSPALTHHFAMFYYAATGSDIGQGLDWSRTGQRIVNLERAYSSRCGITRDNGYTLPSKLDHPDEKGRLMPKEKRTKIMNHYFETRGWDKDAMPTRAELENHGMEDVADVLAESKPLKHLDSLKYEKWYPDKYPRKKPAQRPHRVKVA